MIGSRQNEHIPIAVTNNSSITIQEINTNDSPVDPLECADSETLYECINTLKVQLTSVGFSLRKCAEKTLLLETLCYELRTENERLSSLCQELYATRSWRMTSPYRFFGNYLRKSYSFGKAFLGKAK